MKYLSIALLFSILFLSACTNNAPKADDRFVPFFQGQTLKGWEKIPDGDWQWNKGVLTGKRKKSQQRHSILISDKKYNNFILKFKFKSIEGNSGLYLRVKKINHKVMVTGFQAEIDSKGISIGGLYETKGRAWVVKVTPEKVKTFYKHKDWNEMQITANGRDIKVEVNGVTTADLKNDKSATSGHIGFQLHGGQEMNVSFKDVFIKILP